MKTYLSTPLLVVSLLLAFAFASPVMAQTPFNATITVTQPGINGVPANPYLLGNNTEWVNWGDGMLVNGTLNLSSAMVTAAQQLSPTVLRYPGGTLSDLYHWQDGISTTLGGRGANYIPQPPLLQTNPPLSQTVAFGTREFLQLCRSTNAVPVITVNVITGTAQEAADWVTQTNITGVYDSTGARLPSVYFWEIGNEPYLQNSELPPDQDIQPAAFAAKVNQFVTAMKAVDPNIKVILPVRNDTYGGQPVTPFPGYNNTLFSNLQVPIDYVAVHNGYMPAVLQFPNPHTDTELYLATMAGTRTVASDMLTTQAAIAASPYTVHAGIALTEYNALYTAPQPPDYLPNSTDRYISSLAGGLYIADLLRLLTTMPNVRFANFWSLSKNWHFGVLDPDDTNGNPRPAFWSLFAFRQLLQGTMAPVGVSCPTFSNPTVGYVQAHQDNAKITSAATISGNTLRIFILNKDPVSQANLTINLTPSRATTGNMNYLVVTGPSLFATASQMTVSQGSGAVGPFPFQFQLNAHSFILLTVPLQ